MKAKRWKGWWVMEVGVMLLKFAVGCFACGMGMIILPAVIAVRKQKLARRRAVCMTAEEIQEMSEVDRQSAVAKSVPHLAECMIIEAEQTIATAKPYSEGYGYVMAKASGVIEACVAIQCRWEDMLDASKEERTRRDRKNAGRK